MRRALLTRPVSADLITGERPRRAFCQPASREQQLSVERCWRAVAETRVWSDPVVCTPPPLPDSLRNARPISTVSAGFETPRQVKTADSSNYGTLPRTEHLEAKSESDVELQPSNSNVFLVGCSGQDIRGVQRHCASGESSFDSQTDGVGEHE